MNFVQARGALKKYDVRLLTQIKNAHGSIITRENGIWEMHVWVTKRLPSHRWLEKLTLDGLPVKVKQVQAIHAQKSRTAKWRPAPGGVSIGHVYITAGTLGSSAYRFGERYILSNNHVLANSNDASIGDPIYQPGPLDGGTGADQIGTLYSFVPIIFGDTLNPNYVDCALCKPDNASDVLDYLLDLGRPGGLKEAEIGEEVIKSGRTTEVTEGTITGFSGLIAIIYENYQIAYFDDQIITTGMSSGGDSGSLLLGKNTRAVVGLLFAGSSEITVYNRAERVAAELGIDFYGEKEVILEAIYDIHPFADEVKFYQCSTWTEGSSHGGDIDLTSEITSGIDANVFDDVSNVERVTGGTEYRKIYVRNENTGQGSFWEAVRVWILQATPAENDEIWITTEGTSQDTQADAVSYTYYQPYSSAHVDAQDIGSLVTNGYHHIWIKRQVTAAGGGYHQNKFKLALGSFPSLSSSFSSSSWSSTSSLSSCSSVSVSFSSSSCSSVSESFSSSSCSSYPPHPGKLNQGAWESQDQGAWQAPSFSSSSCSSSFSSSSFSSCSFSFSSLSSSFSSSSSSSSFSSSFSSSSSSFSSSSSSSVSSSCSSSCSSCSSSSCSSSSSSSSSYSSCSSSRSSSCSFSSSSWSSLSLSSSSLSSSYSSHPARLNQGAWENQDQGAWQVTPGSSS